MSTIDLDLPLDDHGPRYLESRRAPAAGDIALFGVPFDGTTSFRPGARFGPDHIRSASIVLESYSPDLDLDLAAIGYCDLGNLEVPMGPPEPMVELVREAVAAMMDAGLVPLMLGGEHSVSTGAVASVHARYPDLLLVQLDAHGDLRASYLGQPHNHACTMRRCLEIVGERGLIQVGIRSGTRAEFAEMMAGHRLVLPEPASLPGGPRRMGQPTRVAWAVRHSPGQERRRERGDVLDVRRTSERGSDAAWRFGSRSRRPWLHPMGEALGELIALRGARPIYLTVDLDVFDPAVLPGTGTPEPGGIFWPDFRALLDAIPEGHLVAADVVELAPGLDPTGASSVYAAKVVREVALRLAADQRRPRFARVRRDKENGVIP